MSTMPTSELAVALAAEILEDDDVTPVFTVGTNLFSGRLPDDLDAGALILANGGSAGTSDPTEDLAIQILVRGEQNDPDGAYDWARRLHQHMDHGWRRSLGLKTEIITTNWRFLMMRSLGTPGHVGFDEKHRPLVSGNVVARIAPVV